jgi:hypothetical protein
VQIAKSLIQPDKERNVGQGLETAANS